MTSYDEVAYPSLPLTQTQPDRMATQAVLHGCRAPDPRRSRVLEIGCSDAGNLAWLAARAPRSSFLGIDLSEAAVTRARDRVTGLDNIEVRVADLGQLDEGSFDFVIAHGVLSWLPDPDALLACVDRHLAEDGVAYVSYNVMPGSLVRAMAGNPIRRFTAGRPERVDTARRLMSWITAATVDSPHAAMMRTAMSLALAKPDHLLVHDELADANRAFYVDEFVPAAAAHRLSYLGECHLADTAPPPGIAWPKDLAAAVGTDEVARQQVLDYARNRSFRQTLLVRPANAPNSYLVAPERIAGLSAATPVQRVAGESGRTTFRVLNGVELTTDDQTLSADLEALGGAWPGSLPVARLDAEPATLLRIHVSRGLELRVQPALVGVPGDRPFVEAYARARAAADGRLASLRHEALGLEDALSRAAVSMMDGQTTRTELAARLSRLPGAPPDVTEALSDLIDRLAAASLFPADPLVSPGVPGSR